MIFSYRFFILSFSRFYLAVLCLISLNTVSYKYEYLTVGASTLIADEALAFWDGSSRGTAYTIELFKKLGKKVTIIKM